MKIGAVIMASGVSKRMGKNKLLLKYKGRTFIENMLDKVIKADFYKIVVTVSDKRVQEICEKYIENIKKVKNNREKNEKIQKDIKVIPNKNFLKGMSESIKLGIKFLGDCNGYMFFSGDQPQLSVETIKKIMENAKKDRIVVPEYGGKRGLPTIFGRNFVEELSEVTGDTGGRQVILNNMDKVKYVKIENAMEGVDIDTMGEYESLIGGNSR